MADKEKSSADSLFMLVRIRICFLPPLGQLPLLYHSVVQHDAYPGSERVGEDVGGAGVSRRKKRLEHLNREADCAADHHGDESCPPAFAYQREVGAKTHAERNESSNVLEDILPISRGHIELVPERFQKRLVQDGIGSWNGQSDTGAGVVMDYVAGSLVEQVESNNVFVLIHLGLPVLSPSIEVPENGWRCELIVINRQTFHLTGPRV
jgi:hypothetical protein